MFEIRRGTNITDDHRLLWLRLPPMMKNSLEQPSAQLHPRRSPCPTLPLRVSLPRSAQRQRRSPDPLATPVLALRATRVIIFETHLALRPSAPR